MSDLEAMSRTHVPSEAQGHVVVPTRFFWRYGGKQVHLCGSFTRWVETIPMSPLETHPGVFVVVVNLPPGYHQYKFIVDGEWRHDESQAFMPDPLGNVNNWLFIRRPETTSPALTQPQFQQETVSKEAIDGKIQGETYGVGLQAAEETTGIVQPLSLDEELKTTRKRVTEFLLNHTAYELIPESGKVVLLDANLPVRQAFHALYEQGIPAAPVWDGSKHAITGMISAGDFIHILRRLRSTSKQNHTLSEADMDAHTILEWQQESLTETRGPKQLVYVKPEDTLEKVAGLLVQTRVALVPLLSGEPDSEPDGQLLLHLATLSGVLACLNRHFRASAASLPLLSQPLERLPIGTWAIAREGGLDLPWDLPPPKQILALKLHTPLTDALQLLLEARVSALPVLDDRGGLLDIYARSDIIALARGKTYSQLNWDEVTVAQALTLAHSAAAAKNAADHAQHYGDGGMHSMTRACVIGKGESLRAAVERLSIPGVRRLLVVGSDNHQVEAVVSLSDVSAFLFT